MNYVEELLKLPVEIKELEEEQFLLNQKILSLKREMASRVAVLEVLVTTEKDENGKQRYSNVDARKNAVILMKNNDGDHKSLRDKYDGQKDLLSRNKIEFEFKLRMFGALKRIVDARVRIENG